MRRWLTGVVQFDKDLALLAALDKIVKQMGIFLEQVTQ